MFLVILMSFIAVLAKKYRLFSLNSGYSTVEYVEVKVVILLTPATESNVHTASL